MVWVNAKQIAHAKPSFSLAPYIVHDYNSPIKTIKLVVKEGTMLAIEEWGTKRFKPVVALAQIVAVSVKECHQVLLESCGPWFFAGDSEPNAWLRLYRQPLCLADVMWRVLLPSSSAGQIEKTIIPSALMRQALMAELRQGIEKSLSNSITQRQVDRGLRYCERLYQWVHLPRIRRLLTTDDGRPTGYDGWLYQPELTFFLSVAMPCWLEYGKTPWELFQLARCGDFHALENLVRFDPEADKEQTLKTVVFRMSRRNPAQYKLLNKARLEGRKSAITLADVKFSLGGLLMRWSKEIQAIMRGEIWFRALEANTATELHYTMRKKIKEAHQAADRKGIKCWLKAPDIKALFDAIAKDTGTGLVDTDFAGQPNAIYKRLERNAKLWPSLQETDISRAA